MSLYFTIPFLTLLAIFQSTAAPQIRIAGGYPDLLLITILSWALAEPYGDAYVWAFTGGLAVDLISGGPFGASALGYLAVVVVADRIGGGLVRDRVALPLVTAFVGTFAFHGVYLIVLRIFGWPIDVPDAVIRVILPTALINMLLSPIVFRLMLALHRRVMPTGVSW
jgi:rod shape-determining protein MreD